MPALGRKSFPAFVLRDDRQRPHRSPDHELYLPVANPSDDRSKIAWAYDWASRIIVVALEMVLPGVAGYWIDTRLGTVCLFLVVGLAAGCIGGVWHLLRLVRDDLDRPGEN